MTKINNEQVGAEVDNKTKKLNFLKILKEINLEY